MGWTGGATVQRFVPPGLASESFFLLLLLLHGIVPFWRGHMSSFANVSPMEGSQYMAREEEVRK